MLSKNQLAYRLNKVLKKGGGELPFMEGNEFLQEEVKHWLKARGRLKVKSPTHMRKSQEAMKRRISYLL
jgi:hypothetical protein